MVDADTANGSVPPLLEIGGDADLTHATTRAAALDALEGGGVVLLSQTSFELTARERELILDTQVILPGQKERDSRIGRPTLIMYPEEGRIERTKIAPAPRREIEAMMLRFSSWAETLVETMLPGYRAALQRDRVTYRPCDRSIPQGLHVDTSYGRPSQGRAMLRVFSNINRRTDHASGRSASDSSPSSRHFLPAARATAERSSWLLRLLGITRGQRNAYDRLIADIRRLAKGDAVYQERAPRRITEFPSGSTWVAITDLVVHGAMSGQHSLDQSFFLPAPAMHDPSRSSLRILERLTGAAWSSVMSAMQSPSSVGADSATILVIAGRMKMADRVGHHDYVGGCALIAAAVAQTAGVRGVAVHDDWPEDETLFDTARSVVCYSGGGAKHGFFASPQRADRVQRLVDRGIGLVMIHQAVRCPVESVPVLASWIGGAHVPGESARGHWRTHHRDFRSTRLRAASGPGRSETAG